MAALGKRLLQLHLPGAEAAHAGSTCSPNTLAEKFKCIGKDKRSKRPRAKAPHAVPPAASPI